MARFEVTHRGANGLKVGDIVEADSIPAWLHGKAKEVEAEPEKVLEVATPKRGPGRPPKE